MGFKIGKQKEFKEKKLTKDYKGRENMKATKKAIKRVIAIALLFLGGYYLFIAVGIIPSKIVLGNYYPSIKELALISVAIIIIALLLDDSWRTKIKNAFS
ncbi:MAG: hypothetical protein AABX29_06875 [Nanoarchaeota archaeon]